MISGWNTIILPSIRLHGAEDPRRIASMVHPSPILPRALDLCFQGMSLEIGGQRPAFRVVQKPVWWFFFADCTEGRQTLKSCGFWLRVPFLADVLGTLSVSWWFVAVYVFRKGKEGKKT